MCGRFTQTANVASIAKRFGAAAEVSEREPRFNVAPGQGALAVVAGDGGKKLTTLRWGLVPAWAKDAGSGSGYKMINARAESVAEKPAYRGPLKKRRCLIVADGFYEWKRPGGKAENVPVYIRMKSGEPFAMAGLWEERKADGAGDMLRTFTVVTVEANDLMSAFHHRMPAILTPEDEEKWLDPAQEDPQSLKTLLKPYPSELMEAYEVSRKVNSPAFDSPECIEPVGDEPQQGQGAFEFS